MSGGTPKTQTVTQTSEPPAWAIDSFKDMLGRANGLADTPYTPYTGQLVAGTTSDQDASYEMIRQMAGGPSIVNNGMDYAAGLLGGQGQWQGGSNPYFGATNELIGGVQAGGNDYYGATNQLIGDIQGGTNGYLGATNAYEGRRNPHIQNVEGGANQMAGATNSRIGQITSGGWNPYIGAENPLIGSISGGGNISAGRNAFAGANPYVDGMIAASSRDVTEQFTDAKVPAMLAQFQAGGAFGGTAMQNAVASEQDTLAQNLGELSNQYRFQDYQTQQGMEESRLSRQAQLSDSAAQRQLQASMAQAQLYDQGMGRSASLFGEDAARSLAARTTRAQMEGQDLSRNAAIYGQDADRALQGNTAQAGLYEGWLGRNSDIYGQDLSRNAALGESGLGRNLQAATTRAGLFGEDLSRNAGLGESFANRDLQASTTRAGLYGQDLDRNSSLGENALGRDLSAWGQYQGNQLAALGMIPGLNQSQYLGASMLGTQGEQQRQMQQQWLDSNYGQFLDARGWEMAQFNPLLQGLAAVQGGSVTGTSPYQGPSAGAGALGGAASGAAMGSAFGPWGTGIGAVAGGLMGYFGSR